jgi:hypothetical protein
MAHHFFVFYAHFLLFIFLSIPYAKHDIFGVFLRFKMKRKEREKCINLTKKKNLQPMEIQKKKAHNG